MPAAAFPGRAGTAHPPPAALAFNPHPVTAKGADYRPLPDALAVTGPANQPFPPVFLPLRHSPRGKSWEKNRSLLPIDILPHHHALTGKNGAFLSANSALLASLNRSIVER